MNAFNYAAAGWNPVADQQARDLQKALLAGDSINPPGAAVPGDGFALRIESLEGTLRSVNFRMEDIKLTNALTRLPAYNTVEEHNLITGYGAEEQTGFFTEGGLPTSTDSTYVRQFVKIKYMGTLRAVSHPMMMIRSAHGDAIGNETVNGTRWLSRAIERALFSADENIMQSEFSGLDAQIRAGAPENILDLRGAALTEDNITEAARVISDAPNFGRPTDIHMSPTSMADLIKQFYPRQRAVLPDTQTGMLGMSATGMMTQAGAVRFQPNVFVTDGGPAGSAVGTPNQRPGTPTQTVAPAAAGSAAPLWTSSDAGTYIYQAVALNKYGRSAPLTLTAVVVGENNTVTFSISPDGSTTTEAYAIYRSTLGGNASTARLIRRVKAEAGVTIFADLNEKLPGTTEAYMVQSDTENMALKQLGPSMIKVPLALLDTSLRWLQLSYLAFVLYTPRKNFIIRNIGQALS